MISGADTAWVLVSSALVLLMIPGIASFFLLGAWPCQEKERSRNSDAGRGNDGSRRSCVGVVGLQPGFRPVDRWSLGQPRVVWTRRR